MTLAMKLASKIDNPIFGFIANGYKIIGEYQKSCMSTAKYHKCAKH